MNAAVAAALYRSRPSERHTLFLRACLYSGDAGRRAWVELTRQAPLAELLRDPSLRARRLAPLLFAAVRHQPDLVDEASQTVLRTSYLREQNRSKVYLRGCGLALAALERARIPLLVFRGAALAEPVYGDPALRHSHDVDILVAADDIDRAAQILSTQEFSLRGPEQTDSDIVTLAHESGLPIVLHSRLFQVSYYQSDWDGLWARSEPVRVAGCEVRTLAPSDALLIACYGVLHRDRLSGLTWACDAYHLMRRFPALDWSEFLRLAHDSGTELPAYLALSYLKTALQAPVPVEVLAPLERAAEQVTPVARDVALATLRRGPHSGVRTLLRAPTGWRLKVAELRSLVLPSTGYLRWAYRVQHPLLVPLYYPRRILRQAIRAIASPLRRVKRHLVRPPLRAPRP